MKKAVLLLAMVTIIAGCIYLKNADKDTVLFKQQVEQDIQYSAVPEEEYTEETIIIETANEESISEENLSETVTEEVAEETIEATVVSVEMPPANEIASVIYKKLAADEQLIYKEILESLLIRKKETELSTTDSKLIDKAFTAVMIDHPEIFYVDGYKYTEYARDDKVERIVFTGKYLYDEEEITRRQALIDARVGDILAGMPDTEDEYLRVKYLYDTLVTQTEYDLQSVDNQNICSVFLNKKSVCQGYAKALQYLANKAGLECCLVLGNVIGGEGHAWNLMSVNDNWYYLDSTWGDAFYLFGNQEQMVNTQTSVINYDYLCVTTKQLLLTHNPDMPVDLPECVSMADNYYVREGLYFTGYDETKLEAVFARAIAAGQETVTFKCSDTAVYDEMYRVLLDEQKIFELIGSTGTIAYTDNKEQGIFTFWLFDGRY